MGLAEPTFMPRFPVLSISPLALRAAGLALLIALPGACGSGEDGDSGSVSEGEAERQVTTCFFTDSAVYCAPTPDGPDAEMRTRVEDFYPSACTDGDNDHDGVPDFLDYDDDDDHGDGHGDDGNDEDDGGYDDDGGGNDDGDDDNSGPGNGGGDDDGDNSGPGAGGDGDYGDDAGQDDDYGDDAGHDDDGGAGDHGDEYGCRECNRGPGESGDFRLEVDRGEAKLDRGRVYLALDDTVVVPTPYGEKLIIRIGYGTRIDDGTPSPGAEIRVEGRMLEDGSIDAERVKVLCDAPFALPPDDVPPECEAVDPWKD